MKYAQHRSRLRQSRPSKRWKGVVLGGVLVTVVLGIGFGFMSRGRSVTDPASATEEVEVPFVAPEETIPLNVEDVLPTSQIDLTYVGETEGAFTGVARRGVEGDLFTHVVVADLPFIDSSQFYYEGWLVKPGVVEFFSTGQMFPREDGKWGLVWESRVSTARPDLSLFTEVVITREERDGNVGPSIEHVLEGTF